MLESLAHLLELLLIISILYLSVAALAWLPSNVLRTHHPLVQSHFSYISIRSVLLLVA